MIFRSMLQPIKFVGIELENRVVRSATYVARCDTNGIPKQSLLDFYASLSAGHPGLLIMEHAYVIKQGQAAADQLAIDRDEMTAHHRKLLDVIKAANPKTKNCC